MLGAAITDTNKLHRQMRLSISGEDSDAPHKTQNNGASEVAQLAKSPLIKLDDLSSVPEIHMVKGQKQLLKVVPDFYWVQWFDQLQQKNKGQRNYRKSRVSIKHGSWNINGRFSLAFSFSDRSPLPSYSL